MNRLTKSQKEELKALWEGGNAVMWLDKLREYDSERADQIPAFVVALIEKARASRLSGVKGLNYTPPECTSERLQYYASAPDNEVIIEAAYTEGFSGRRVVERATAGMLRSLLAAISSDPKALSAIDRYWQTVLREIEDGETTDSDEPSWQAVSSPFDNVMTQLFGRKNAVGLAGTKLRNIAIHKLARRNITF